MRKGALRVLWLAAALGAVVLAGAGIVACTRPGRFDGSRAYRDVVTQCQAGPRLPNSQASLRTSAYIAQELRRAGWAVEVQDLAYDAIPLRNVIGKRGRGPLAIIGAHYDCRAQADRDPEGRTSAVPGANDGASGTAVLLELARTLDPARLHQEVWLAFFDAEDQGRLDGWPWSVGAGHVAANLVQEPEFVIVVDMVGDADQRFYWERSSTPWLSQRVWELAARLGYGDYFVPSYKHHVTDDHTPFLERGIPALDIIDFDYHYWHTTADTPDKVSAASLERVGRVVECLLESCS